MTTTSAQVSTLTPQQAEGALLAEGFHPHVVLWAIAGMLADGDLLDVEVMSREIRDLRRFAWQHYGFRGAFSAAAEWACSGTGHLDWDVFEQQFQPQKGPSGSLRWMASEAAGQDLHHVWSQVSWLGRTHLVPSLLPECNTFWVTGQPWTRHDIAVPLGHEACHEGEPLQEFTRIDYMYRDRSNYKQFATLTLRGAITAEQLGTIHAALEDDSFIPTQIGLGHLGWEWPSFPDDDDDHIWHELQLDTTKVVVTTADLDAHSSVADFVETMRQATGKWDDSVDVATLG